MKGIFLALTLASGFLWAWWGTGTWRARAGRDILWFPVLLGAMALMEGRALAASVPWRGDEDHHMLFTGHIAALIASHPAFLAVPILIGLAGLALSGRFAATAAMASGLGLVAAFSGYHTHLDEYFVLRYPIFLKYLTAVPVYLYSTLPGSPPPEIPYRILPLLASAATVWYAFLRLSHLPRWMRLLAALFLASLPLVRYYSTIFYLEMPAVLCMTVVLFNADTLLRSSLSTLIRSTGWYALLMLGFIKETTLPFLAAFLVCRLAFRWHEFRKSRASPRNAASTLQELPSHRGAVFEEGRVVFCVFLPLAGYLFYRILLGDARPHPLIWGNLADPVLLGRLVRSFTDSFALLLPLAAAGIAIMARRGEWPALVLNLLVLSFVTVFHALDYPQYVGYGRFNLFLLPSLLRLAWSAVAAVAPRSMPFAAATLAMGVAVNVGISPIHSDGSKKCFWGVYGEDAGEHYYPYRQAFRWIEAHDPGTRIRMTGHDYLYYTRLYQDRGLKVEQILTPRGGDAAANINAGLDLAARAEAPWVLYQIPSGIPDLPPTRDYALAKVFRNRSHVLLLYRKIQVPPKPSAGRSGGDL